MDPKSIANLDPKLRETYERVMGTVNQAAPMPELSAAPVAPEPQLSSPLSSQQVPNTNIPASTPYTPPDVGFPQDMQPLASPASVAQSSQNTGPLIKILYIVGGIIFFIVYVFFWVKIFNYQLPF